MAIHIQYSKQDIGKYCQADADYGGVFYRHIHWGNFWGKYLLHKNLVRQSVKCAIVKVFFDKLSHFLTNSAKLAHFSLTKSSFFAKIYT